MNLRRIVIFTIVLLSVAGGFARPQLHDLDIRVVLSHDGNAFITETRQMTIDDEGTECYIGLDNMGAMKVEDLSVKDETGTTYTNIGEWDVDRSRSWKAGKCGIVHKYNNGYELCWGLGDSGERTYVTTYTIDGFVQRHPDADAFRHIFLGSDVSQKPEHAKITIVAANPNLKFSPDSCGIWGFRFHGELKFEDGAIIVETTEPMEGASGLYVMAGFAPGLFEPTIFQDVTFKQKREEAFEGSDYNEDNGNGSSTVDDIIDTIIGFVAFLIAVVFPILVGFNGAFGRRIAVWRARRKIKNKITWFRGIPLKGNLKDANDVLNAYSPSKADYKKLISASVLRLINIGAFSIRQRMNGKGELEQYFMVHELPAAKDQPMFIRKLHTIFDLASGDDKILDPKELKNFMKDKSNKTVTESFANVLTVSRDLKYYKNREDDVLQVFGLKKYLEDFTLLDERHIEEVKLWKNYMVYATLFGIADQVIKDMKKINPDFFKMDELASQMSDTVVLPILIDNMNWGTQHVINRIAAASASSHTYFGGSGGSFRSGGGGGHSSWGGGGGGFSGGGGGGVR